MSEEAKIFGGRWRVVDLLGRGGQGVVYRVEDTSGGVFNPVALGDALHEFERVHSNRQERARSAKEITDVLTLLLKSQRLPTAALKELLPIDEAEAADAKAAFARMKNEIATLTGVTHPALIRVFESDLDHGWFVMEYFRNGPMSKQPGRFKGQVTEALHALRPVVEAVRELHKKGIVHRDVKPDNIFVGDDGHLVLGDCGLAIKLQNQERLTLTFENVGTRDYQPPWTYGTRVENVKPNFDVFGLAKLLWAMISGRPRFPLEDFDIEPHDLRKMFPDEPGVMFIHRILKKCIVRREPQCAITDAGELLHEIDEAIRAMRSGAQVPGATKMRCRFCGIGSYAKADNFAAFGNSPGGGPRHFYCCDHCGHLEIFAYLGKKTPPGMERVLIRCYATTVRLLLSD